MSLHYAATGTRTLCGRTLSPRMELAPLWPDFLRQYEADPDACCAACLHVCKGWARFSRDLAMVNERRRQERARRG